MAMARNRGKKALYEVMSKARTKPVSGRKLEQLHSKKTDGNKPAADRESVINSARSVAGLWKKPKIIQINSGRVEFSIPYQIMIALLLVFILMVISVYRFGQFSGSPDTQSAALSLEPEPQNRQPETTQQPMRQMPPPAEAVKDTTSENIVTEPVGTGDNVIIIARCDRHADLVPVKEHFKEYGIETEIVMNNGVYFLQTKNRYENPGRPGTDGYKALQRIIQVGAEYKGKAPKGYGTFAPHYFSDAYGKKVEE